MTTLETVQEILEIREDIQRRIGQRDAIKLQLKPITAAIEHGQERIRQIVRAAVASGLMELHTTYILDGTAVVVTPLIDRKTGHAADPPNYIIHVSSAVEL